MTTDDKEQRTANMAFAIAGVPCFADTFVQGGGSVLRMDEPASEINQGRGGLSIKFGKVII